MRDGHELESCTTTHGRVVEETRSGGKASLRVCLSFLAEPCASYVTAGPHRINEERRSSFQQCSKDTLR